MTRRESDREGCPYLTPQQVEEIAERAAEKALDKVAMEVGRGVIRKIFWVAGASTVVFYFWLKDKGLF